MAYADSDGSTLKFVEETIFNTTPANSTSWKTWRAKGWDMKPSIQTVESEELSANIDVREVINAGESCQLSVTGEYAKDTDFELLLEHVFRSTFATNVLKGGTVKKSLSVEELIVGTGNSFGKASGIRLDTFGLTGRVGGIVETSFSGMGGAIAYSGTSAVGTGSTSAASTRRVMSLSDLASFTIAGDSTPLTILDLSLNISNSTREQWGAGSTSVQGIGYGTRRVSGSLSAYFETSEQLAAFKASAVRDLSFVLTDGTNSHTWRLPRLKYTDGGRPVSGRSSDIVQRLDFTGTFDATAATAVMVTRTAG